MQITLLSKNFYFNSPQNPSPFICIYYHPIYLLGYKYVKDSIIEHI